MWKNAKGVVKPLDATMAGYENENAVFIARTNFLRMKFTLVSLLKTLDAMFHTAERNIA